MPTTKPKKVIPKIESWSSDRLKPYPRQGEFFADLSDSDLHALADNMERYGQLEPIEITSDGTIISGHQRLSAARLLEWSDVDVWVRADLEAQGPEAVERRFLEANMHRRHLTDLDKARTYLRLKELARGKVSSRVRARGDLRDHVAGQLGVSGRTLDRYVRILRAPIEVQKAYEAKKLTWAEAGRVADVDDATKEIIAQALRNGEDPKAVVAEHAPQLRRSTRSQGPDVDKTLKKIENNVDVLLVDMSLAKRRVTSDDLPALRKVNMCMVELARHVKEHPYKCLPFGKRAERFDERINPSPRRPSDSESESSCNPGQVVRISG